MDENLYFTDNKMKQYVKEGLLKIRVVPTSSREELVEEKGELKLYLKAVPVKGKANDAIIKFFKKKLKWKVEIVKGLKSRDKVLKVY